MATSLARNGRAAGLYGNVEQVGPACFNSLVK